MKKRNKKNNSLTQSPHNQGKAGDVPVALIQWFYEETLSGDGRQTRGGGEEKQFFLIRANMIRFTLSAGLLYVAHLYCLSWGGRAQVMFKA